MRVRQGEWLRSLAACFGGYSSKSRRHKKEELGLEYLAE